MRSSFAISIDREPSMGPFLEAALETFRARKLIFSRSLFKDREVNRPEFLL